MEDDNIDVQEDGDDGTTIETEDFHIRLYATKRIRVSLSQIVTLDDDDVLAARQAARALRG